MATKQKTQRGRTSAAEAVDKLVLATVNAPYKRKIGAETLAACLAIAKPDGWTVHVATFFTEVSPRLVLAFAAAHGLYRTSHNKKDHT